MSDFDEEDAPIFDTSQLYGDDSEEETQEVAPETTREPLQDTSSTDTSSKDQTNGADPQAASEETPEQDEQAEEVSEGTNSLKSRLLNLKMKINQGRKANKLEVEDEFKRIQARRKHEQKLRTKQNNGEADEALQSLDLEEKLLNVRDTSAKGKKTEDEDVFELKDSNATQWYDKKKKGDVLNLSILDAEWLQKKGEAKRENLFSASGKADISTATVRAYEKDIKKLSASHASSSVSSSSVSSSSASFDPTYRASSVGLSRLAEDVNNKIEKRKASRAASQGAFYDEVTSINDKNERFNKKLKRSYDKYTVEIKKNLERGTAL